MIFSWSPSLKTKQGPRRSDAGNSGRRVRFSGTGCSLQGCRDAGCFLEHGKSQEPAGALGLHWGPTGPTSQTGAEGDVLHPHPCTPLLLLQPSPSKGDHGMRGFLPSAEQQHLDNMRNGPCPAVIIPLEPRWGAREDTKPPKQEAQRCLSPPTCLLPRRAPVFNLLIISRNK